MATDNRFVVEPLPWKSKKSPKEVPWPLPKPGEVCFCALARRQSGKTTVFCCLVRAYRRFYEKIIVLSPTVMFDPKWKAISSYENVLFGEDVNNEVLERIAEDQKAIYKHDRPNENRCLLIIDDSSTELKRKNLRYWFSKFTTMFRHWGGDLIWSCHALTYMEGAQIQNILQFAIWDLNRKALRKLVQDTATARVDEDALFKLIKENTRTPHSCVFIDYTKNPDETFWINFDRPYKINDPPK